MWSSKPKAKEYTGFTGDVGPEQQKCLDEFKAWVNETGTNY